MPVFFKAKKTLISSINIIYHQFVAHFQEVQATIIFWGFSPRDSVDFSALTGSFRRSQIANLHKVAIFKAKIENASLCHKGILFET